MEWEVCDLVIVIELGDFGMSFSVSASRCVELNDTTDDFFFFTDTLHVDDDDERFLRRARSLVSFVVFFRPNDARNRSKDALS